MSEFTIERFTAPSVPEVDGDPALTVEVGGGRGMPGERGLPGEEGKSAYEHALDLGFTGTLEEWIDSLQGVDGDAGAPGQSAYEIAVDNGFAGTELEWLDSLQGIDGDDGDSAYEVAVAAGFTGTLEEWLASLKGEDGAPGSDADATAAIAAHSADTTDVHGIANTADLVLTSDPRLSDARTPTTHTHDDRYYTETEVDTALAGKANASHTHTAANVTDLVETVQDIVGAQIVAGSNVTVTYNDTAGTVTIAATGGGGGSSAASDITVVPTGNIAATDVQAALAELDIEKIAQGDRMRQGSRALPSNTWVKLHSYDESSNGMVIWALKVNGDSTDINVDGGIIVKHGKDYVSTPGYSDTLQVYTLAGSAGTIIGNNAYVGDGGTPYNPPTDGSAVPDGYVRFELGPIWPYSERGRWNNRGDFIIGWNVRTTGRTYTQSGTTVTQVTGTDAFTANDVGAYLMWTGQGSRGQVDRITAFIDATHVTVETSRTQATAIAAEVRVPKVVVRNDGTIETAGGMIVKGRPGQTGNLLKVEKADGTTAFSVAADGTVTPSGGAAGVAVEDEGSQILAAATRLNFTGGGVTVTDAGSGEVTVAIPGGGGGGTGGLKDFASAVVTSGDISLTATTVTGLSAADLVLTADAGDVIEYGISARFGNQAQYVALDVYTMVAGARANPFGDGIADTLAGPGGVTGWFLTNTANLGEQSRSGSITRTLTSGDVSGGTCTLRLHYAKSNTTARTLYASSGLALRVWAKNYGPPIN